LLFVLRYSSLMISMQQHFYKPLSAFAEHAAVY
jgi:hypothetical protein